MSTKYKRLSEDDLAQEDLKEVDTTNSEKIIINISGERKSKGTYSEVFKAAGFGKWQFLLLMQCGWANASDAIEIMCISFTMSSMHRSLNISNEKLSSLTIALFLGMMVGGYLWGSLADSWGRRKIVIQSLFVNSIFSALSAFAHQFWLIVLLRFLSGVGAGGSLPVCFSYFSEFQPNHRRGAMISALATFWMAGNIVAAGLALVILPSASLAHVSPSGDQWRLFVLMCSLPSFTSAILFCVMPESPLFLIKKGRTKEAFGVLEKMHKWNHRGTGEEMPFSGMFDDDGFSRDCREASPSSSGGCWCSVFKSMFNSVSNQCNVMFSKSQGRRRRSLAMSWVTFSIAFTYGLSMWLPTLIERAERTGSACKPPELSVNGSSLLLTTDAGSKSDDDGGASVYVDVFIGAVAQFPANLLAIFIIDRTGGKPMLIFGFILSGITTLLFWSARTRLHIIIINALFNCSTTVVWDAVDVILPELYETRIRASANGFLTAWSRIAALLGNAVMGAFIDSNCTIPLLTFSTVLLSGAVSSIFLPNTKGIDLG